MVLFDLGLVEEDTLVKMYGLKWKDEALTEESKSKDVAS